MTPSPLSEPQSLRADLTRIVLEWQRPMYNLAFRMLGNEHDAADATQEIFITLIRNVHAYDRERDFRPWIYRLATNVLRNFIRDSKLRRLREGYAAMEHDATEADESLERAELEAVVQAELRKLPESHRALIVLHYYHGLSQEDVAAALDIPRSTAQSRIQKALTCLKRGLATSGYLASVPNVEALMKSSAALAVPPKLSASLLAIAANAGAASATVAAGLTLGGILMTKQIIGGALAIGLISLGVGMWAGRTMKSEAGARPSPAEPAAAGAVSKADHEKLRKDYERALAQLAQKEAEARQARESLASIGQSKSEPTASASGSEPDAGSSSKPAASASEIDWSRFAELFGKNVDLVAAAREHEEDLSPEDQAKLAEVMSEFMKVVAKAKTLSNAPFFDPKIFPGFVEAIFGKSLGLSEAQLAELRRISDNLVHSQLSQYDPSSSLPVEGYAARHQMIDQLSESLRSMLDAGQRSRWDNVQNVASTLMGGDEAVGELGLQPNGSAVDSIYQLWNYEYGFSESQQGEVRTFASTYQSEAERLLRQYGQFGESIAPLSPADRARLNEEFFQLQMRMEREFQYLLTPEQRAASRRRAPSVIRFHYGGDTSVRRNNGNSF